MLTHYFIRIPLKTYLKYFSFLFVFRATRDSINLDIYLFLCFFFFGVGMAIIREGD